MRAALAALACSALVFVTGCSDPAGAKPQAGALSKNSPAGPSPKATPDTAAIGQAAGSFLTAVVRGEALQARYWLTPIAAGRAERDSSVLGPLGLQSAKIEVGEVRLISSHEAAVQCLVTESGSETAQEIGCLMKLCDAGWRVCGVACEAGPDHPPVVLNFEMETPSTPRESPPQQEFVNQNGEGAERLTERPGPSSQPLR